MTEQTITLNSGYRMPALGLGLYKATADGEAENAIRSAAAIGYRLFDTASAYKNEDAVGRGIAGCGIPRSELFITTKVWNDAQRLGAVEKAFERSLDRLGMDYVDLYLIHWPVPGYYLDTWKMLEDFARSGKVHSIGVSNFNEVQLDDLMMHSDIMPAVNQIEYHPLFNRESLRLFCQRNGITVQAYAPLARGAYMSSGVLRVIAEKYHRNNAQIGLRWLLQKGIAVIPKSTREDHLLENSQIFDFELTEGEMAAIDALNENYRSSGIPEDMIPYV